MRHPHQETWQEYDFDSMRPMYAQDKMSETGLCLKAGRTDLSGGSCEKKKKTQRQ